MLSKDAEIEAAWAAHLALRQTTSRGTYKFPASIRLALCEAQNWRCCYCGIRMMGTNPEADAPTIEHIKPLSRGGADTIENVAIACWRCNTGRGNLDQEIGTNG